MTHDDEARREHWWKTVVPAFLDRCGISRADPILYDLLDSRVRVLQRAAEDEGRDNLDPEILEQAHAEISARFPDPGFSREVLDALRFYADAKSWQASGHPQIDADTAPAVKDRGQRAREALAVTRAAPLAQMRPIGNAPEDTSET